jgi:hypothetical protein
MSSSTGPLAERFSVEMPHEPIGSLSAGHHPWARRVAAIDPARTKTPHCAGSFSGMCALLRCSSSAFAQSQPTTLERIALLDHISRATSFKIQLGAHESEPERRRLLQLLPSVV